MSGKQKLSVFHQAQRKQMSRKECPGCKQSFTSRYFRQHREKYFSNNQWNCFKSVSENVEVLSQDSDEEFSDSSSDENVSSQRLHDFFNLMYENIFLKIFVPPSLRVKMRFGIMQVWRI